MTQSHDKGTILVVDDEPHNMIWMEDYISALGFSIKHCLNLNEALEALNEKQFRAAVIDLNIPALEPLQSELRTKGDAYRRFPGLYAASFARNKGYRDRQVIIYSVHQDADVLREVEVLRCTYIIKGRPKTFKEELEAVLSYDPTAKK
jgi:CheY-like chemotaxis protein